MTIAPRLIKPFGILIAYFLLGEKVPLKNIIGLFSVLKNAFTSEEHDYQGIIGEIVEKGEKARKNGVLS